MKKITILLTIILILVMVVSAVKTEEVIDDKDKFKAIKIKEDGEKDKIKFVIKEGQSMTMQEIILEYNKIKEKDVKEKW